MTGISDERGRRACGAAGFVRVGRLPDPARLLRRDRFSSAPRSVQFRIEIGPAGSRPAAGVTRRASLHETGISARVQRGRRRTHAEMSSSMCRGGAPVGLFLRGRGTGLLGQRPPCLTALFLRGRGTGPAPGPWRRRRTRTGMLTSAGLPAADPGGGGGHARNARVGQTTGAGGTAPPPTGSSPGARAASLCSTAPGPRNTFSLIVNIPDRRRPARRQRSRDEGPRVGTDLEPELNRSRRGEEERGGRRPRPDPAASAIGPRAGARGRRRRRGGRSRRRPPRRRGPSAPRPARRPPRRAPGS